MDSGRGQSTRRGTQDHGRAAATLGIRFRFGCTLDSVFAREHCIFPDLTHGHLRAGDEVPDARALLEQLRLRLLDLLPQPVVNHEVVDQLIVAIALGQMPGCSKLRATNCNSQCRPAFTYTERWIITGHPETCSSFAPRGPAIGDLVSEQTCRTLEAHHIARTRSRAAKQGAKVALCPPNRMQLLPIHLSDACHCGTAPPWSGRASRRRGLRRCRTGCHR
jgi:hypothetical protein